MASTSATHLLASQVGGHPGIIESEDGSAIGKPALPLEHTFYEAIYGDNPKLQHLKDFKLLAPFIPKLMGTLRLVGRVDESQGDGELHVVPIEGEIGEPKDKFKI
jgi:1D-myo-inositol-tetrakisphosphate 5-kinase/inositol-polyphosphate multikinase